MENKYWAGQRMHQIKYQAFWQAREYLQEVFKNRCQSDQCDELDEVLEFQSPEFAKEFRREVLKNIEIVARKLDVGVSKKIGKIS